MSDANETQRILSGETQEQLNRARYDEIAKVLKLRLIIKELKRLRVSKIGSLREGSGEENIQRALKLLSIADYMRSDEKDDDLRLLNLRGDSMETPNLTYTERKLLRQRLVKNLQKYLQNISQFSKKLRLEVPELFMNTPAAIESGVVLNKSSSSASSASGGEVNQAVSLQNQIISLEIQRRSNAQQLVTLLNRKCVYLKAAAELKTGPYLSNELELLYGQVRLNYCKANVLHGFFVNELITRSEHSLKAIKEVDGYVNDALEEEKK